MNEMAAIERDMLTGLPGRAASLARLDEWLAGSGPPVHAMVLSLGRFETVNLAYGEAAGDGALAEIARRLVHFAEDEFELSNWIAARLGGGKFLLALWEECTRERWQWLGEALADAVALPIAAVEADVSLRLWPRIALIRAAGGEDAQAVLDRLAEALGQMKGDPGRRITWIDRSHVPIGISGAQLEADLIGAMARDEIELRFQPQYSLPDDRLVGAEALARWNHPALGQIGAGTLFAIAQRADQTSALSRHVAERALEHAGRWPEAMKLSLNVTPSDVAAAGFASEFLTLVAKTGLERSRLTLEITEQVLLGDVDAAAKVLARLHAAGIAIALDDFGAGFCNFRYLKVLPLRLLKLDRAMVDGIADDPRDVEVLKAIIAMARALDLTVVAEGIDSADKRAIAEREGCAIYQGFLKSRPIRPDDFLALVRR
ncbi:EAL domain-containing protein [Altererythrobacter sp. MTPC7]|uniref:EAL domain-containing protein n=1 Tax=Altererythrobacter sp. MTPC7 TaxID=3056567 RepID=UPI0036F2352F